MYAYIYIIHISIRIYTKMVVFDSLQYHRTCCQHLCLLQRWQVHRRRCEVGASGVLKSGKSGRTWTPTQHSSVGEKNSKVAIVVAMMALITQSWGLNQLIGCSQIVEKKVLIGRSSKSGEDSMAMVMISRNDCPSQLVLYQKVGMSYICMGVCMGIPSFYHMFQRLGGVHAQVGQTDGQTD